MINIQVLMPTMSLGLLFILFITGAWRRSYTTTIYVVSLYASMQLYHLSCNKDTAFIVITAGAIISLVRAVVNHNRDTLIKRGDSV